MRLEKIKLHNFLESQGTHWAHPDGKSFYVESGSAPDVLFQQALEQFPALSIEQATAGERSVSIGMMIGDLQLMNLHPDCQALISPQNNQLKRDILDALNAHAMVGFDVAKHRLDIFEGTFDHTYEYHKSAAQPCCSHWVLDEQTFYLDFDWLITLRGIPVDATPLTEQDLHADIELSATSAVLFNLKHPLLEHERFKASMEFCHRAIQTAPLESVQAFVTFIRSALGIAPLKGSSSSKRSHFLTGVSALFIEELGVQQWAPQAYIVHFQRIFGLISHIHSLVLYQKEKRINI